MTLHHRQVKCIPRRQAQGSEHDSFCPFDIGRLDGEDLIDYSEKSIEGRLDRVAPFDGDVPMQDLLKRFDVCHEPLTLRNATFQDVLGVPLVRVRCPHEVHGDVRIDENHRCGESR
jgi:hypothetical protein